MLTDISVHTECPHHILIPQYIVIVCLSVPHSNWSLQLVPQYPDIVGKSDWLWLISTDLLSMAKVCHTFWLRVQLAEITQDTAVR